MLRVKVKIPEIDVPYFDSTIKEEDYDKLKDFLAELDSKFGSDNVECSASVVEPETTDAKAEEQEETDPIAEHIKDHPILNKNLDKGLKDFLNKLDSINNVDSKDLEADDDKSKDSKDLVKAIVGIKKFILTDIYFRDNVSIKRNAVDGTYPVFDTLRDHVEVDIPKAVLDQCTEYNIAKFIQQQVVFTLMDPEYYEIDDDKLDEVFSKDNFDDSYCYDTGIYKIEFYNIYFPHNSEISREDCYSLEDYLNITLDYREMEDIYKELRLFNIKD